MGDILLDMEPLIQEMMDDHDLQHGDFIGLMDHYLLIHYPNHKEQYADGTVPVLSYRQGKKNEKKNG
jgi:hypothetical protein